MSSRGVGLLKKWEELPEILKQDRRKTLEIKSMAFGLVESVVEALASDYDIIYSVHEVIEKISAELLANLEYTTFMKSPVTQGEIEFNMEERVQTTKYGRAMCDMYLPAMATALDLHIRVLQNIGGYFAILNTFPARFHSQPRHLKTINLALKDDKYQPVVYIGGEDYTTAFQPQNVPFVTALTTHSCPIQIVGYTPPTPIVISDEDVPEPTSSVTTPTATTQPKTTGQRKRTIEEVDMDGVINILPQERRRRIQQDVDAIHDNIVNEVRDEVQNLDSSDCSTLPSIRYPSERKRKEFDMSPYKGMVPDLVEKIPYDVDGLKCFIVDVPDEDHYSNKYNDGRYFLLNTSSRKGFKGVRRIGKCQGNYVCNNNNCPFFRQDKKRNQH